MPKSDHRSSLAYISNSQDRDTFRSALPLPTRPQTFLPLINCDRTFTQVMPRGKRPMFVQLSVLCSSPQVQRCGRALRRCPPHPLRRYPSQRCSLQWPCYKGYMRWQYADSGPGTLDTVLPIRSTQHAYVYLHLARESRRCRKNIENKKEIFRLKFSMGCDWAVMWRLTN